MSSEPVAPAPAAAATYFAACRARVPAFAARHFGVIGTLRLHREALGLDLLRAPLNVMLVAPAFGLHLVAVLCRGLGWERLARWLASRRLFVETRLSRRMADLVLGELLRVDEAEMLPDWHHRARHLFAEYLAARHAVAELAAAMIAIGVGMLLVHALTPSAMSLGPLLARELAQQEAIDGFWLGPWAGSIYFGWYPVTASWSQIIGTTLLAMICFAVTATFVGVLTDPLQQRLGLHQQRLHRFVTVLERATLGEGRVALALPDPYIARLADLADLALIAMRLTR